MPTWLSDMTWNWAFVGWTSIVFLVMFSLSILLVGWVVVRLPADYFTSTRVSALPIGMHPAMRWTLIIGKNLLGIVLIVAGFIMFFTPGQGLLTVLIGLMLLDFPGKKRLEARIVSRPNVLHAINALRARYAKPPLVIDSGDENPKNGSHTAEEPHVLSRD